MLLGLSAAGVSKATRDVCLGYSSNLLRTVPSLNLIADILN